MEVALSTKKNNKPLKGRVYLSGQKMIGYWQGNLKKNILKRQKAASYLLTFNFPHSTKC
jgi:hypothetical protein